MELDQIVVGKIVDTSMLEAGLIDQHLHGIPPPIADVANHLAVPVAQHDVHPLAAGNIAIPWRVSGLIYRLLGASD